MPNVHHRVSGIVFVSIGLELELFFFFRLHSDNTGADEWSTHCRDCVPLAKEANRAERDRPSSAKIRMILQLLKEIDERSENEEKTIIFSQFTSMLDLIQPFLNEKEIEYVRCELLLHIFLCNF